MSYRTILVHCGDERRLPALIAVAAPIAKAAKSRIVGLAIMPPVIVVPAMEGAAAEVIEDHRDTYRAEMDRMRDAFSPSSGRLMTAVPTLTTMGFICFFCRRAGK